MPRKNVLERYQAITAGNMSGNLTSPVTNIKFLDNVLMEFVATGSPGGSYSVEVSADYQTDNNGNVINAGNWTALEFNPSPIITGAGTVVIDMNQLSAPYIRAKYTRTSGTGSLNLFMSAKEV
jgi:hypothetical protein